MYSAVARLLVQWMLYVADGRTGELAQGLGQLPALVECLSSVPSTHTVTHNYL